MKLVVDEPESDALRGFLGRDRIVASTVVALVEVPRVARRYGGEGRALDVLRAVSPVELTEEVVRLAVAVDPPELRTLDALHLASALVVRSEIDAFVAYDARLVEAARANGLHVVSPA